MQPVRDHFRNHGSDGIIGTNVTYSDVFFDAESIAVKIGAIRRFVLAQFTFQKWSRAGCVSDEMQLFQKFHCDYLTTVKPVFS